MQDNEQSGFAEQFFDSYFEVNLIKRKRNSMFSEMVQILNVRKIEWFPLIFLFIKKFWEFTISIWRFHFKHVDRENFVNEWLMQDYHKSDFVFVGNRDAPSFPFLFLLCNKSVRYYCDVSDVAYRISIVL